MERTIEFTDQLEYEAVIRSFENGFEVGKWKEEIHPPSLYSQEMGVEIRHHHFQAHKAKADGDHKTFLLHRDALVEMAKQCEIQSLTTSSQTEIHFRAQSLHLEFLISGFYSNPLEHTEKLSFLGGALLLPTEYENGRITDEILLRRYLLAREEEISIMLKEGHDFALVNKAIDEYLEQCALLQSPEVMDTQLHYMRQRKATVLHELGDTKSSMALFGKIAEDINVPEEVYFIGYARFLETCGSSEEISKILEIIAKSKSGVVSCKIGGVCTQLFETPRTAATLGKIERYLQIKLFELAQTPEEFDSLRLKFTPDEINSGLSCPEFQARILLAKGKLKNNRELIEEGIQLFEVNGIGFHADHIRFTDYFLQFFHDLLDAYGENGFKDIVLNSLRCLETKLEQMLIHYTVTLPNETSRL